MFEQKTCLHFVIIRAVFVKDDGIQRTAIGLSIICRVFLKKSGLGTIAMFFFPFPRAKNNHIRATGYQL